MDQNCDDEAAAFGGEASGEWRYHLSSIQSTVLVCQIRSQGLSFQIWPAVSSLVTLLDFCPSALLPHVLPNLRFNVDANSDSVAARGGSVDVRQLRWGEDEDAAAFLVDGRPAFDAVLASDVVYYDHLIDPLLRTLRALVKGELVFVMAHPKRWKNRDAVFFRKARKVFDES